MHRPRVLCRLLALVLAGAACAAAATEDLRVSSNFFDGNYHSISPDGRPPAQVAPATGRRPDSLDLPNHLGKPLVAAARATSTARPNVQQQQQQRASRTQAAAPKRQQPQTQLKQLNKSLPKWGVIPRPPPAPQQQPHVVAASPIQKKHPPPPPPAQQPPQLPPDTPLAQQTACRWLSLREMSNVSYATGEVVIRDSQDQPCYLLTMRAYIKWNEDAYFPLQRYRAHPISSYRVEFEPAAGVAAAMSDHRQQASEPPQRLLLNCTLPTLPPVAGADHSRAAETQTSAATSSGQQRANAATVSLVSAQRAARAFAEELTLQVSCGYLVLVLRGDGAYLALESLSFYQDSSSVVPPAESSTAALGLQSPVASGTGNNNLQQPQQPPAAQTQTQSSQQHLVFAKSAGEEGSPLLVMPTFSRYICQERVVLTGNNSVQLVISRFELKRLTSEPAAAAHGQQQHAATPGQLLMSGSGSAAEGTQQQQPAMVAQRAADMEQLRPRRAAVTTILYKNPLSAVTRCARPSAPGVPLTSMMDLPAANETLGATAAASAGHRANSGAQASPSAGVLNSFVALASCLLLLL